VQIASGKLCAVDSFDKEITHGISGADMGALVREASVIALKEAIYNGPKKSSSEIENVDIFVTLKHFDQAFSHVSASVSENVTRHHCSFVHTINLCYAGVQIIRKVA
jgi:SpoVK/Ycf46/Vps4 family AAA+-type ATPase